MKRKQLIIFILDKSGSTCRKVKDKSVFEHEHNSVEETLKYLMKTEENSLELDYYVQLLTFNDNVEAITTVPMPPEDLLQVWDSNILGKPEGLTSIAAMYDYLDEHLTRNKGGWLENIREGDPIPIIFLLTDYLATDDTNILNAAASKLQKNNNYLHAKHLCLFLGDEEDKITAEQMFGESNVLSIEDDKLDTLLTPVLANSSVVAADCSRIGVKPVSNRELLLEQRETAKKGKKSTESWLEYDVDEKLTDEELQRQIIEALGGLTA